MGSVFLAFREWVVPLLAPLYWLTIGPFGPLISPRAAIFQGLTQYKLSALAPLTWDYLRLMSTPNHRRHFGTLGATASGIKVSSGGRELLSGITGRSKDSVY